MATKAELEAEVLTLKAEAVEDLAQIKALKEDKQALKTQVDTLQDRLDKWQAKVEKAKKDLRLKRRDVVRNHLPGKGN